jgi:hypothetical protein
MRLGAAMALFGAGPAEAQVMAMNLLEAQNGNIPFAEPANRVAVYDQLNLEWRRDRLQLGMRFETARTSETRYDYATVTRRFARWNESELSVQVGNFYTILGRGLVHRSFELTGVVLDQPGVRSSYGPSRDVDGILVEGTRGPVRALAFAGTPSDGTVSPGLEEAGIPRHAGQLSGAEVRVRPLTSLELGTAYARSTSDGDRQPELGSGFLDFDPLALAESDVMRLPIYVEYAQAGRRFGDWWSFDTGEGTPHALYAGANLLWRRLALTAEWKDYSDFRLGTNDPPSLVREHSPALLNRATHVLDAGGEEGFQLEGAWTGPEWASLTLNWSRSDGAFGRRAVRFEERYVELHVAPAAGSRWEATGFYDEGKDEFSFVEDRRLAGLSTSVRLSPAMAVTADLERQRARRTDASFTDSRVALGVSWAGRGSALLAWEHTDDPVEEDPEDALAPPVQARDFIGVAVTAVLNAHHELAVFAGERRGGRACSAGTCYEVLAFKGIETRLTSRF